MTMMRTRCHVISDAAADRDALGIYVVMAHDVSDAIDMINDCKCARTLATLLEMLTGAGSERTDRELNRLMVGPVERRIREIGH